MPLTLPLVLPEGLSFLIPDIARFNSENQGAMPGVEDILFFDLETTGLSGGAGTVAFLAACGRFVSPRTGSAGAPAGEFSALEITQFLLLDYPGEVDFLDAVLGSLSSRVLATYNGKAFDSQILKIRCLMNGMSPPLLSQLDLLHPSRRLWKQVLPNCSQALIETAILGLDRSGDLPGSLAPDIWFEFLRSGGQADRAGQCQRALLGICDHNIKDIFGLASLFRAFVSIAAAPLEARRGFRCDAGQLALCWRRGVFRASRGALYASHNQEETAALLLERAADDYPYPCLRLALDLRACLRREEARARLLALRAWPEQAGGKQGCPPRIKALALRALSIDAEKISEWEQALAYIDEALALFPPEQETPRAHLLPLRVKENLERRRERLLAKVQLLAKAQREESP
jgi:uncharacterized protein YprB with RNaseH-like and TPR domain